MLIITVVGVSGAGTSQDAISGLEGRLGSWVLIVGYVFGVVATFTSFITLGLTAKKLFWYDYKLPQSLSWFLACFIPLALYIAGFQDFINIIGLTGAGMLGLIGIMITLIYYQLKKREKSIKLLKLKWLVAALTVMLSLGVLQEFVQFFSS